LSPPLILLLATYSSNTKTRDRLNWRKIFAYHRSKFNPDVSVDYHLPSDVVK
jgi:hypothetical protein